MTVQFLWYVQPKDWFSERELHVFTDSKILANRTTAYLAWSRANGIRSMSYISGNGSCTPHTFHQLELLQLCWHQDLRKLCMKKIKTQQSDIVVGFHGVGKTPIYVPFFAFQRSSNITSCKCSSLLELAKCNKSNCLLR